MAYEIVVIGASLGGLDAVSVLLGQLPAVFPLPVAVCQHRTSIPHDGNLASLWQQSTSLPVGDAEDKMAIERSRVYVAPADYHLLVEARGMFALSTDPPVLWARPSIDVLFESAAEAYGAGVIAVILTGASADGAQGLKAVRDHGGCALVQDPATAECAVMPRAAMDATPVNHVMGLHEIGRIITALAGPAAAGASR